MMSACLRATTRGVWCVLLSMLGVVAIASCTEIVAPSRSPAYDGIPAIAGTSGDTIVVFPDSMRGWTFRDEATDSLCDAAQRCTLITSAEHAILGSGSAVLGADQASGARLLNRSFAGSPLRSLTALSVSFRPDSGTISSADAPVFRFEVDFDTLSHGGGSSAILTSIATNEQLTELRDNWRDLDASHAGWWLSHEGPVRERQMTIHPCVRSRPCTWDELRDRYPEMRIAQSSAIAVQVSAGTMRRYSIDRLQVGIDGRFSLYDFEREPPVRKVVYRVLADSGLIDNHPLADTLVTTGTTVEYGFTARPGHEEPIVFLDDSLVASSGRFVVRGPHRLIALSDTIITRIGLTPSERGLAQYLDILRNSDDKAEANQLLLEAILTREYLGTPADTVEKQFNAAYRAVFQLPRDSALVRQVDRGLQGWTFELSSWPNGYPKITKRRTSISLPAGQPPFAPASSSLRAPSSRMELPTATQSVATITGERTAGMKSEPTAVIYMNGIANSYPQELQAVFRLRELLRRASYVADGGTTVWWVYNKNEAAQLDEFNAQHPCLYEAQSAELPTFFKFLRWYARCEGQTVRFVDLVETFRAMQEIENGYKPSDSDVYLLRDEIKRAQDRSIHAIVVAHSEGTLLSSLAIGILRNKQGRSLAVGNSCVGMVGLAPLMRKSDVALDPFYAYGLIAEHDIVLNVNSASGWELFPTSMSRKLEEDPVSQALGTSLPGAAYTLWRESKVHAVLDGYMRDPVMRDVIRNRITLVHSECQVGKVDVAYDKEVVQNNEQFHARAIVTNEHDRPLYGRQNRILFNAITEQLDSITFRAVVPYHTGIGWAEVRDIWAQRPLAFPLVQRAPPGFTETNIGTWQEVAASNGDQICPCDNVAPTTAWDGESACGEASRTRVPGAGTSWVDYELVCSRIYRPASAPPDTLPSGVPVQTRYTWSFRYPGSDVISTQIDSVHVCGEERCVVDLWVDQFKPEWYSVVASSRPGQDGTMFLRAPASEPLVRPAGGTWRGVLRTRE